MSRCHDKVEIVSTKSLILMGQQVLDQIVAGEPCPICKTPGGDHTRWCRGGEAVAKDPAVRRLVMAAKEDHRG